MQADNKSTDKARIPQMLQGHRFRGQYRPRDQNPGRRSYSSDDSNDGTLTPLMRMPIVGRSPSYSITTKAKNKHTSQSIYTNTLKKFLSTCKALSMLSRFEKARRVFGFHFIVLIIGMFFKMSCLTVMKQEHLFTR